MKHEEKLQWQSNKSTDIVTIARDSKHKVSLRTDSSRISQRWLLKRWMYDLALITMELHKDDNFSQLLNTGLIQTESHKEGWLQEILNRVFD